MVRPKREVTTARVKWEYAKAHQVPGSMGELGIQGIQLQVESHWEPLRNVKIRMESVPQMLGDQYKLPWLLPPYFPL